MESSKRAVCPDWPVHQIDLQFRRLNSDIGNFSTSASSLFSSLKSWFESLVTDFSFIAVQLNVKKGQCELFLSCDKLSLIIDVFLSRTWGSYIVQLRPLFQQELQVMGGKVNVHKWRFLLTRTKVRMIYIFTHMCMSVEKKENAAFESNMEKTCDSIRKILFHYSTVSRSQNHRFQQI